MLLRRPGGPPCGASSPVPPARLMASILLARCARRTKGRADRVGVRQLGRVGPRLRRRLALGAHGAWPLGADNLKTLLRNCAIAAARTTAGCAWGLAHSWHRVARCSWRCLARCCEEPPTSADGSSQMPAGRNDVTWTGADFIKFQCAPIGAPQLRITATLAPQMTRVVPSHARLPPRDSPMSLPMRSCC